MGKFKNARTRCVSAEQTNRKANGSQTNNKQTRGAQRDLIVGDDRVVIVIVA
jgi:hypothetical protein